MDALDAVETALREHLSETLSAILTREGDALTLQGSPDGLDVVVSVEGKSVVLAGGGWHDHYDVPQEAADMAMWLLSERARIVATVWGDAEFAWTFEILNEGNWTTVSTMGIGLPRPFWRKRRKIVRQNRVLA